MVAVRRNQNGCPRCQSCDVAITPVDGDEVVDLEWIADAEQHTGDVILNGIAHREADRQTDDTCGAEQRAQQRRGIEQCERQRQGSEQHQRAQDLSIETGDKHVGRKTTKQAFAPRQPAAGPPAKQQDQERQRPQGRGIEYGAAEIA